MTDLDDDAIARFVTEAYQRWQPHLPELCSNRVAECDRVADCAIQAYWSAMQSRRSGWCAYYEPFWYRAGGDAWASDQDWLSAGKFLLSQRGWEVAALEILLTVARDEYLERAVAFLHDWSARNWESIEGLLAAAYPDHQRAREYVEEFGLPYGDRPPADVVATGAPEVVQRVVDRVVECLNAEDWWDAPAAVTLLGRERALSYLAPNQLTTVRKELLKLATDSLAQSEVRYAEEAALSCVHQAIGECAATMGWVDVFERLQQNPEYLHQLFFGWEGLPDLPTGAPQYLADVYRGLFSEWPTPLLAWSWALPHDQYAGQMAAWALLCVSGPKKFRLKRRMTFERSLSAAIAWKRFRSAAPESSC